MDFREECPNNLRNGLQERDERLALGGERVPDGHTDADTRAPRFEIKNWSGRNGGKLVRFSLTPASTDLVTLL